MDLQPGDLGDLQSLLEKLAHGLAGPLWAAFQRADLIHSRDLLPLLVAHASRRPWSFETYRRHAEEKPWLPAIMRRLGLGRAVAAVAHSPAAAQDLVELGFAPDTVQAIRAIRERYRDVPKYDVNRLNPLWLPELDGIREDPRFKEALAEVLDFAGLSGAILRRAPPER